MVDPGLSLPAAAALLWFAIADTGLSGEATSAVAMFLWSDMVDSSSSAG